MIIESPTWPGLLAHLIRGEDLALGEANWAMDQLLRGSVGPERIAGFAVALRAKGESAAELQGLVAAMMRHALRIEIPGRVVDTCGSGGSGTQAINISTMAAVVVAATGTRVVKHGNRAASSTCGSADLLEELGVVIDLPPEAVVECAVTAGITFCFAPLFHPALRYVAAARRELGVATVFNFLGPLVNPAQPQAQIVGVSDAAIAPVVADVLAARGCSALVCRGDDGLDELTTTTTSRMWVVRDGTVNQQILDPRDVGIQHSDPAELRGAGPAHNADVARKVFAGATGPVRDAVLINAGAALAVHDGIGSSVEEGIVDGLRRASEAIDSGAALATLNKWVSLSHQLASLSLPVAR
jgi:anthranilate phosphoribosyltransferase